MKSIKMNFAPYKSSVVELKGGINENVSSLELIAGELIDCKNYMIAEGGYGGYASVKGFERFDGGILPSEYPSYILTLRECPLGITEGQLITSSGGATATALEDGVVVSGSYVGGDAVVEIQALINSGIMAKEETTSTVSGATGTLNVVFNHVGGTPQAHDALDFIRDEVVEVPGEGQILGLHIFKTKCVAFRKKVGLDQIGMYYESAGIGWVEIDTSLDPLIYTSLYTHEFNFSNYNFYAGVDSYSMFWVDGVNKARSWDGSNVVTITNTEVITDEPINVIAHNNYLFLAYRFGELMHSVLGDPTTWVGGGNLGMGNEITNLIEGQKSSLIIYLDEGISILQGVVASDFSLEVFSRTSGAYTRTVQRLLGTVFFVDDRGVTTMEAVQEFGDYGANSISQKFKRTLQNVNHAITTTITNRGLNQYRICFDDRQCIFVSFEGKEVSGATFIEYPKVIRVAGQGEDSFGRDYIVFAGNDQDGYVYRLDSGTSMDGEPIICRMGTAFYHYKSPRQWKAFKKATLEVIGDTEQTFDIKVDFDYNELGNPKTLWYTPFIYTEGGGAVWGEGLWGTMVYGNAGTVTNRVPLYLQGVGTNMNYKIISNETYRQQHIVQNIITDYEALHRRI